MSDPENKGPPPAPDEPKQVAVAVPLHMTSVPVGDSHVIAVVVPGLIVNITVQPEMWPPPATAALLRTIADAIELNGKATPGHRERAVGREAEGKRMRPDSKMIEPRFKEALSAWIECAHLPGHFLTAVLENNLKEAVARGDGGALDNLPHIVAHLYNDAPAACWGSPANVSNWTGLGPAAMAGWREAHP